MEQDLIKLMADTMSAFCLFQENPGKFDWTWLKKQYGLSNEGLQDLQSHMLQLLTNIK